MELSRAVIQSIHLGEFDIRRLREYEIDTATELDYITEPITYERFFIEYLLPNKACVFGTWATEGWTSRQEWVTKENKPNIQFLKKEFGDVQCPVADCKQARYDAHTKKDMSLGEFVDYMEEYRQADYPSDRDCLYLKDWHFQRQFPEYEAYDVPPFFRSDWMNEFWDGQDDSDDYRFVYIGPKGSWTPFHSDVLRSYSWSANICGRKKWVIYPPGEEQHLKNNLGHLAFDLNSPDLEDSSIYPSAAKVTKKFEVYQESGEIIFVPSGWHHQVYNVEDTISINHNWLNGCNVDLLWLHLVNSMKNVQREINDCCDMDDWASQCQLILRADAGMDYADFYRLLHTIADKRIHVLQSHLVNESQASGHLVNDSENQETCTGDQTNLEHSCDTNSSGTSSIMNHFLFDLMQIRDLLFEVKRNKEFLMLDFDKFVIRPKALLKSIESILSEYID